MGGEGERSVTCNKVPWLEYMACNLTTRPSACLKDLIPFCFMRPSWSCSTTIQNLFDFFLLWAAPLFTLCRVLWDNSTHIKSSGFSVHIEISHTHHILKTLAWDTFLLWCPPSSYHKDQKPSIGNTGEKEVIVLSLFFLSFLHQYFELTPLLAVSFPLARLCSVTCIHRDTVTRSISSIKPIDLPVVAVCLNQSGDRHYGCSGRPCQEMDRTVGFPGRLFRPLRPSEPESLYGWGCGLYIITVCYSVGCLCVVCSKSPHEMNLMTRWDLRCWQVGVHRVNMKVRRLKDLVEFRDVFLRYVTLGFFYLHFQI